MSKLLSSSQFDCKSFSITKNSSAFNADIERHSFESLFTAHDFFASQKKKGQLDIEK
jgi:hypothetical protein